MKELEDQYTESRGRVFKPLLYTDDYVFMRSDFHGHVELRMCRRDPDTGEVSLRRAAKFVTGFHNPQAWLQEHSMGLPQNFVPSTTREIIGECDPCVEAEQKAEQAANIARLNESRQKIIDLKNNVNQNTE